MAVKEDGLWRKPLNSFGPGEFLSSDIGNVSGKHQIPCSLGRQDSTYKALPTLFNTLKELSVWVVGQ